jgi:hypothetical protein
VVFSSNSVLSTEQSGVTQQREPVRKNTSAASASLAELARDAYNQGEWDLFFMGAAKLVIEQVQWYGHESVRKSGKHGHHINRCTAILEKLHNLKWATFLARVKAAQPTESDGYVPVRVEWEGTSNNWPPFAVVVALIIQWAAVELSRPPHPLELQ